MERAREYDRISEILARTPSPDRNPEGMDSISDFEPLDHGIEARRAQFDKNSYRQPVLTQKPMIPKAYRRAQEDHLTDECKSKLNELRDYSLMTDTAVPSAGVR